MSVSSTKHRNLMPTNTKIAIRSSPRKYQTKISNIKVIRVLKSYNCYQHMEKCCLVICRNNTEIPWETVIIAVLNESPLTTGNDV